MRKNQNAFTLLEIMLVVSIIAVLLSVAIYRLRGNLETSKLVAVQSDIQSIRPSSRSTRASTASSQRPSRACRRWSFGRAAIRSRHAGPVLQVNPEGSVAESLHLRQPGPEESRRLRSLFGRAGSQTRHARRRLGQSVTIRQIEIGVVLVWLHAICRLLLLRRHSPDDRA